MNLFKTYQNTTTIFGSVLLISLSISTWKLSSPFGDYSLLSLIPLAIVVFLSSRHLMLDLWEAKHRMIIRKNSGFSRFFHGRIRANIFSVIYAIVTVTALCAEAISSTITYMIAILICAIIASSLYLILKKVLHSQLNHPFHKSFAITYAIAGASILSFGFLSQIAWSLDQYNGFLLTASLTESIQYGLKDLPNENSLISFPLSVFLIIDVIKLWLTIQLNDYAFVVRALAVDIALVSFVISRLSISITYFVENFSQEHDLNE